ncbi:MAG: hypothetical protein Alis3KO_01770 [Aliiglaciecola sp.]|uniref:hypothetical protein n=1 Tax=Aliiglaciecola sp. M165 TaxID=2593649 RepID=UPI00117E6063|nr:hypothetical protein [Aliiglaciecola sp. M165]TRY32447.1 hypothetical protein FM019_06315 [Aliiglaciecola sp. M165]
MSKLDKEQVVENFVQAYTAANGKAPEIEAKGGWYSVDGGKNVRLAALEEMTQELSGSAAPAKVEKAAEKTEKPAKAAKATKKPAAKKATKKKADSGFSVKAYWAEQILERNPGSRLPR